MAWGGLTDMRRTPKEKAEEIAEMVGPASIENVADYPYGLSITLEEDDLEKLGLDHSCDVGDMIDLRAFAEVTSVSKRRVGDKDCCRVELTLTMMAVENESTEEPGE